MNKLVDEYSRLATDYDERWASYLAASFAMTEAALASSEARAPGADARVLDVACGTGLLLRHLTSKMKYPYAVGIDRVPAMLERARQAVPDDAHLLLQADAASLPLADRAFSLVVSTSALHYFPDPAAALREMRRVLAPGGTLVITDWCRDYLTIRLLDMLLPLTPEAHVRAMTLKELCMAMEEAGFGVQFSTRRRIDWCWGLMTVRAVAR